MKRTRNRISKPHFNLRDKSEPKTPTSIFLFYQYRPDRERLKYSIGQSVLPEYWDQKGQKARVTVLHPEYGDMNDHLAKIVLKAKEVARNNPKIEPETFKQELDYFLGIRINPKQRLHPSLFEFIAAHVEQEKTKVNAKSTWKKIHTLLNHLKQYCQDFGLEDLDYKDINWDFKNQFENWCYSPPRSHSQNTMSKNFEELSNLMGEAYKRYYTDEQGVIQRYHTNDIPGDKKFSVNRVKTSHHPLSSEELHQLLKFNNLPDNLTRVKDMFLMSAFGGGYRYSDYERIKKENITVEDGIELLKLYTTKGDTKKFDNEVVIPILPEFKELLTKYNYIIPKPLSPQKSNEKIKLICQKAGLDRSVEVKESIGGQNKISHKPLWQLVTNHTARYSFITYMLNEMGANPAEVANMTGQSLKIMYQYVQGDKAKSAIRFARKMGIGAFNSIH